MPDPLTTITDLTGFRKELLEELHTILEYWEQYATDHESGGFYGRIDNDNNVYRDAAKGVVLNARILWAFSAAVRFGNNDRYLQSATRAYQYLVSYFIDQKYGGVYWSVDHRGFPLETRKQIYAHAFVIYALSEYFMATGDQAALELAIRIYDIVVLRSYDYVNGGYGEALSADWNPIGDLRLSQKDANEKKSMNTHLHVLEGFTNLYRAWKDETLRRRIRELIGLFRDHIVNPLDGHLDLFFDDQWRPKSTIISYGHDIEAAWLILEAAGVANDAPLLEWATGHASRGADGVLAGLDVDGGLWYEADRLTGHLVREKHSWPQAEAMVGFFNAWEVTGQPGYLRRSLSSWRFIRKFIVDPKHGEWFWGVTQHYDIMQEDKVGPWKCPYHNTRACMELIKRIDLSKNE